MMICPANSEHKEFSTTAVVIQHWRVDGDGRFIECEDDCNAILDHPDDSNEWICCDCGEVAIELEH
mgnify:CR=1 FL=1